MAKLIEIGGKDIGKRNLCSSVGENVTGADTTGNIACGGSSKKIKIELPIQLSSSSLGIYLKKRKHSFKKMALFTAASLNKTAKIWNELASTDM